MTKTHDEANEVIGSLCWCVPGWVSDGQLMSTHRGALCCEYAGGAFGGQCHELCLDYPGVLET